MWALKLSKSLVALVLTLGVACPTAWGQEASSSSPQDFLIIETLLSMQGAVLGGGGGVLLSNVFYEVAIEDCDLIALEAQTTCRAGQEIFSLCVGYAFGLPAGATLGILLSEKLFQVRGNIWYALMGSMIGELIGVPQCSFLRFLRSFGFSLSFEEVSNSELSLILNPFVLTALGAMIGYHFEWLIGAESPATPVNAQVPVFHFRF